MCSPSMKISGITDKPLHNTLASLDKPSFTIIQRSLLCEILVTARNVLTVPNTVLSDGARSIQQFFQAAIIPCTYGYGIQHME